MARHEAAPVGGVGGDVAERAAARRHRAADHGMLDDEPADRREDRARHRAGTRRALTGAQQPVGEHEGDRAEREVELPGQRHRDECGRAEREPARVAVAAALEAEQGERQQEGHHPEQVPRRLHDAVRGEGEGQATEQRGAALQAERAQPPAGRPAGDDVRDQHHGVPRHDGAEQPVDRPVRQPVEPALQVEHGVALRLERVRVAPRRGQPAELVADEPHGVAELEVVAGRGLAVARVGPREVGAVGVAEAPAR